MTQDFGGHISATVMYGSTGALSVENREIPDNNPNQLRAMIRPEQRQALAGRVVARTSRTGTRLIASYETAGDRWAALDRLYATDASLPMPGLNLYLRQPVPFISRRSCRVEATADLRNLLAQGYLSMPGRDDQSVMLVETPRSVRAGP